MGRQLRILVVDDDTENADAIAELFACDNHDVMVAYGGQQAVTAFDQNNFDLGFFDVMMPGKNGVESFLEIRSRHPHARIYFMTGYSESELLDKARNLGAMGTFGKPADPVQLLEAIEREAA